MIGIVIRGDDTKPENMQKYKIRVRARSRSPRPACQSQAAQTLPVGSSHRIGHAHQFLLDCMTCDFSHKDCVSPNILLIRLSYQKQVPVRLRVWQVIYRDTAYIESAQECRTLRGRRVEVSKVKHS